jgi:hypothetical protein
MRRINDLIHNTTYLWVPGQVRHSESEYISDVDVFIHQNIWRHYRNHWRIER